MNKFKKIVSKSSIFYEYLKAINGILDLSDREVQIFSMFMDIDYNWDKCDYGNEMKYITCKGAREHIIKNTKLHKGNLSKYIAKFFKKGLFLSTVNSEVFINKGLMPNIEDNSIILNIEFELK
jgi:hypothetical protein